MTSTDLDLTFNCEYDLSHKVVTNQIELQSVNDQEGEVVSDAGNVGFDVVDESGSTVVESTHRPRPGQKPQDQTSIPVKEKEKPTHESTFNSPVSEISC